MFEASHHGFMTPGSSGFRAMYVCTCTHVRSSRRPATRPAKAENTLAHMYADAGGTKKARYDLMCRAHMTAVQHRIVEPRPTRHITSSSRGNPDCVPPAIRIHRRSKACVRVSVTYRSGSLTSYNSSHPVLRSLSKRYTYMNQIPSSRHR